MSKRTRSGIAHTPCAKVEGTQILSGEREQTNGRTRIQENGGGREEEKFLEHAASATYVPQQGETVKRPKHNYSARPGDCRFQKSDTLKETSPTHEG